MVGATAFICKPIDENKVLDLAKELTTDKLNQNQQNLMMHLESNDNTNLAFG